ncbi:hypothetical protein TR74_07410 [Carbonactinospora thermoautotrophica]|uniref:Uncharacterized protein n=1 Tax=Carbonactinospora thermoautotrophica TaxID=1469144 RepID=A0A132NIR3_9ACTN|nr:hypothetical protein [Carbonactinospora thermoautotrophica]KWX09807.1 hypothetical protein TR74_07410 [Carbonactinospora thermoautotrophica]
MLHGRGAVARRREVQAGLRVRRRARLVRCWCVRSRRLLPRVRRRPGLLPVLGRTGLRRNRRLVGVRVPVRVLLVGGKLRWVRLWTGLSLVRDALVRVGLCGSVRLTVLPRHGTRRRVRPWRSRVAVSCLLPGLTLVERARLCRVRV